MRPKPFKTSVISGFKFFTLLLFLFCTHSLLAQKKVTGVVTDASTKAPLVGVSVTVKGTAKGAVTNANGKYQIAIPKNAPVIVFSYLGYLTKELLVGDEPTVNIEMEKDELGLDEVVVIGYGTQKKSDLTGSVSIINSEQLQMQQNPSLLQSMQGLAPGVQVTNSTGELGGGVNLVIRGQNSINASSAPLYVIDGVQIDVNENVVASSQLTTAVAYDPLSTIDPANIESIDILKDASATAIYGSRGANGVVIITTKSGKAGKTQISYSFDASLASPTKLLDMLDGNAYRDYQIDLNGGTIFFQDTDNDGVGDTERDPNTLRAHNWQREAFKNAFSMQHQLSLSGGNASTNYSVGLGYLDQDGTMLETNYKRYNLRAKLNLNQTKRLKFGVTFNTAFSEMKGAATTGTVGNFDGNIQQLVISTPFELLDDDGDGTFSEFISPLSVLTEAERSIRLNRTIAGADVKYDFTKDFAYFGELNGNFSNSKGNEFYNSLTRRGNLTNGEAIVNQVESFSYNHSSQLRYNKTFNQDNQLNALAGFEIFDSRNERFANTVVNFENQLSGANAIQLGSAATSYYTFVIPTKRLSYLGRLNYNLKSKYLLTASFRADGTNRFGSGNKWGYFPSGAFAWNMHKEGFMKGLKPVVSLFKPRIGVGVTGNDRIPAFAYLPLLVEAFSASDDRLNFGLAPGSLANPDLKWEETTQYNAGLDIGLLKNRVSITLDAYLKQTRDLLLSTPIPAQVGDDFMLLNLGRVDHRGLEIAVTSSNIQRKKFSWNTNFNISFNRNEVKQLSLGQAIPVSAAGGFQSDLGLIKEGEPIGRIYALDYIGVYQLNDFNWQNNSDPSIPFDDRQFELKSGLATPSAGITALPGKLRYRDVDNDGDVDLDDRTYVGDMNPDFFGGITNSFTYGNLDLSVFLQGSYGNDIYNAGKLRVSGYRSGTNISTDYYNNHWSEVNPSNTHPGYGQLDQTTESSWYVEDGSYLRLKTVNLGYTLPKRMLLSTGIESVRIGIVGTNLITWTNYTGIDPEVSFNNPLLSGLDRLRYPNSRTINFNIRVKF